MRGGKREGAGRKKEQRTLATEKMREFVINKIAEEMTPILQGQIEAAKGIWIEKEDKIIYQRAPDNHAAEYLLNQGIGKPKETLDIDTNTTLKINF